MAGDIEAEGLSNQPGAIASVVRRVFGDHNAIMVKGQGDMLVYRARCCNPIRGESIVGYITRGKGVAVHAVNCPNVTNLMYEPERRIDVEWARDESTPTAYPVKLTVYCDDRFGMRHWRRTKQHPQHRGAHGKQPGQRGDRPRHRGPQTPRTNHGRAAEDSRCA